jgi:4'-phosphopantetheinyl transferase
MAGKDAKTTDVDSAGAKTDAIIEERTAVDFAAWTPTAGEWERLLRLVQPEERARIGRFRRPVGDGRWVTGRDNPDAKSSLLGRLLLRRAAARAHGIAPADVELARSPYNKPVVAAPRGTRYPHFNANVSHAGSLVVLGSVAGDDGDGGAAVSIGVDVMPLEVPHASGRPDADKRIADFFRDMRSSFSVSEWHAISRRCDAAPGCSACAAAPRAQGDMVMQFFTFWVLKESYIKAVGVGLHLELDRMEFELAPLGAGGSSEKEDAWPREASLRLDGADRGQYRFAVHFVRRDPPGLDHLVGVCLGPARTAGPATRLEFRFETVDDVVAPLVV